MKENRYLVKKSNMALELNSLVKVQLRQSARGDCFPILLICLYDFPLISQDSKGDMLSLPLSYFITMTQTNILPLGSAYFGNSSTLSLSTDFHQSRKSVMPSNHLILCCPLLLPPSIFPSIRIFSNDPSNEYSRLISFRIDWMDLLAVQGTLKSSSVREAPEIQIGCFRKPNSKKYLVFPSTRKEGHFPDGHCTCSTLASGVCSKRVPEKHQLLESEVAQSCSTLCDPVDCSPPGPSIRGILQARILEWKPRRYIKKKGTLCQATLGITFSSMNERILMHECYCHTLEIMLIVLKDSKISVTKQKDIDECSDGFVQCDSRANCINLPGWYHCECRDGYHDNGMFSPSGESCEDIDECGTGRHSCANDTICFNLDGGYDCRCPHGKNCTGDCIHDGKIKHNGQIWVLENDRCSVCSCQNGFVMCRRMVCDCENPTVDLFCCPECDPRLSSQCLHQNGETLYNSGDTWVQNCQQCRCLQGEVDCWPLPCPEVECEFSVLPENECCPRCVTDPCQADTIRNDITKTCLDEMNVVRFTGSSWIKHGTECTLCHCK
ncbi:hypothetical protein FD754_006702, partial [Muntiacus muntjak]